LPSEIEDNMDAVVEHQVRGGGVPVPGVGCSADCAELYSEEQSDSNSAKWALVAGRQGATKLLPKLLTPISRLSPTVVVGAGTATFVVGVVIGDTVARKILHLYPPDEPAPIEYGDPYLDYFSAGNTMASGGFGEIVAPVAGFRLGYTGVGSIWTEWLEPPFSNCPQAVPPPDGLPAAAQEISGSVWADCSWTRPAGFAARAWVEFIPLVSSTISIDDYTGTEPHDGAIEDWPGKPATKDEVEARLRQLLESDPYLRAWYRSKLDPAGFRVPDCGGMTYTECRDLLEEDGFKVGRTTHEIDEVQDDEIELGPGAVVETQPAPGSQAEAGDDVEVITNPDRPLIKPDVPSEENADSDCDYAQGTSVPPAWDVDGARFTQAPTFSGVPSLGVDPDVDGSPAPAILRYGNEGWGRLKIALKHGWTADAERDTRLAIAFGFREPRTNLAFPGSRAREYTAVLPQRAVAGKICGRQAVVEYAYNSDDEIDYPNDANGREKGVITSFGFRAIP
jgi:hypothetical protein